MTFPSVHPALARALAARGYTVPTAVQLAVLEADTAGRDLLVSAQTGSGKTVAFGLAIATDAARRGGAAAAGRRAAGADHRADARARHAGAAGARLALRRDGRPRRHLRRRHGRARRSPPARAGAHIVVGTPGRLRDHLERNRLDLTQARRRRARRSRRDARPRLPRGSRVHSRRDAGEPPDAAVLRHHAARDRDAGAPLSARCRAHRDRAPQRAARRHRISRHPRGAERRRECGRQRAAPPRDAARRWCSAPRARP